MTRDPSMTASDPQVSAWVAANAGAGKTYTLANRVARLLLAGSPPEKILCLTFTKAAAAEMQDRLFKQLGAWAMLPDDDLRAEITRIGADAHTDLRKARRLFAAALETPGGLKILTLHGFCQAVLARFPIEAGVPPAFDVLDEPSAREMIASARAAVLARAGSGEAPLAAAVAFLATETGEFRLAQLLDSALGGDRRKLDALFGGDGDLNATVRDAHGLAEGETAQNITGNFCAELKRDIALLKSLPGWLASGSDTDKASGAQWQLWLGTEFEAQGFGLLQSLLLTKTGEPRKKFAVKKLTDARPDLLEYLTRLQEQVCGVVERRKAARAADLALAALTVIGAVRSHYQAAKRLRGVLDYDDLIFWTRTLLAEKSAAQWVLYKLDGGIDHLLIDEAQDTSPDQWEIVKALTAEFFAGQGRDRTVFAVGDEKQSIFSFQGADPRQFDLSRQYFEEAAQGAGARLERPELITSRRSAPQLLQFVDQVFATEAARTGLTFSGAVVRHEAHRDKALGGIEFWPALRPEDSSEPDPWEAPVNAPPPDNPVVRLARQVADHIARWLDEGARLPGHDRAIRPGDIMILLPRREPFGSEVIRQLKRRGVPVAGADRVRLTEQIAAMDLMALGRFVLQREDDLTLAALLRSPLGGLSEDDLFKLAHGREGHLWPELVARKNEPAFAAAHGFLSAMLERADYAPPYEFYAHALIALDGRTKLLRRLGTEAADVIEEFLSLTLSYERGHAPSLEGFLDWVAHGGTEIKRDMERGRDEVRVMTVHGAKGLEADIVILPDTTSQPGGLNRHDGLLFHEGQVFFPLNKLEAPGPVLRARAALEAETLNEHRRLLYVALTRARDRLYVCGFQGKREISGQSWYSLIERAAISMGVPVTRGDGEITTIGTVDDERGTVAAAATKTTALPGWAVASAPGEPARPRALRPSDAVEAPATISPRDSKRFERGLVVHALLARLPEVAHADRGRIALAFAKARGIANPQALVAETLAVLDDPTFAAAFAPGARAEAGLLADIPELAARVNGRMDRLAVTESTVLILDYKTNRPAPVAEADIPAIYLAQMALYRAAARVLFPGRRITCGLVFTEVPRLLALSDAALDAQMAAIAARLDRQG